MKELRTRTSRPWKWIAFSGEYAGNNDVYVVASEGGEPKRLTWHPVATSFKDGHRMAKSVMFSSSRAPRGLPRRPAVLDGSCFGRVEEPMALPRASRQDLGGRFAHRLSMNNTWDEERRNYRGGQNRRSGSSI
jgi:tricorn protease